MFATTSAPNRHGLHTHAHTNTHTTDYNWIHLMDTANCLDWQRGHGKWSGPGHLDKVVGFTNLSNIILLHSFLFVLWLWRNAMFVSRGLSCHCVLFSVCVYPPCVKMVLAARCIYVHCSVLFSSQVLSGMCIYVDPYVYCWFLSSTSFRGLAGIFNRAFLLLHIVLYPI